jgi:alpha-D-ribose 1-methylphosphonate 5-triphosphate synthase subunit PhnL
MNIRPILNIEKLCKSFFLHEQGKFVPSVANLNLALFPGQLAALIGPTGCGKTSVLKCVYRTYLPTSGRIEYLSANGRVVELATANEQQILDLRKEEIGFVTQFLIAVPRQSALDVVAQPLYARGITRENGREAARSLLSRLRVPERLWSLSPLTFSGGEKQRINFARGMISGARLLLMDEPTASLDPATRQSVVDMIKEMKSSGTALLAVFHDPGIVEALAEHIIELPWPTSDKEPKEATE